MEATGGPEDAGKSLGVLGKVDTGFGSETGPGSGLGEGSKAQELAVL